VYIDASKAHFIDHDIKLMLQEFSESAQERGISVDYKKR
jgi:hypothetical protein